MPMQNPTRIGRPALIRAGASGAIGWVPICIYAVPGTFFWTVPAAGLYRIRGWGCGGPTTFINGDGTYPGQPGGYVRADLKLAKGVVGTFLVSNRQGTDTTSVTGLGRDMTATRGGSQSGSSGVGTGGDVNATAGAADEGIFLGIGFGGSEVSSGATNTGRDGAIAVERFY